jgi:glycosyltransferase involved in cell wall biosynthesis
MTLKVSIITVCRNASSTITATLNSVASQSYKDIEHVVVDGNSNDGTQDIVRKEGHRVSKFVSESDKGIYDAMRKGASLATGDILYFLNSGDVFFDEHVVSGVVASFEKKKTDIVFGDLLPVLFNPNDSFSHCFAPNVRVEQGFINHKFDLLNFNIHHQTIFYRKEVLKSCGFFSLDYPFGTDWGLHAEAILGHKYTFAHVPMIIAKFALGGVSTSNFEKELSEYNKIKNLINEKYGHKDMSYIFYKLNKKFKNIAKRIGKK